MVQKLSSKINVCVLIVAGSFFFFLTGESLSLFIYYEKIMFNKKLVTKKKKKDKYDLNFTLSVLNFMYMYLVLKLVFLCRASKNFFFNSLKHSLARFMIDDAHYIPPQWQK